MSFISYKSLFFEKKSYFEGCVGTVVSGDEGKRPIYYILGSVVTDWLIPIIDPKGCKSAHDRIRHSFRMRVSSIFWVYEHEYVEWRQGTPLDRPLGSFERIVADSTPTPPQNTTGRGTGGGEGLVGRVEVTLAWDRPDTHAHACALNACAMLWWCDEWVVVV